MVGDYSIHKKLEIASSAPAALPRNCGKQSFPWYHAAVHRLTPIVAVALVGQLLLSANPILAGAAEQIRTYTRSIEFDYISWTLDATFIKLAESLLGTERYLTEEQQSQLVRDHAALVAQIQLQEGQLSVLHADPDAGKVAIDIETINLQLHDLNEQRRHSAPIVEGILQDQVQSILSEFGITAAGQPIPPVLYHSTPLPWALIVSPRTSIAEVANISLQTALGLEDHIQLEDEVSAGLDLSTLVVPVGGVGTYPTMVAQSSDINWLAEVVAHEWTHNYLTWHPLGLLYLESPELQTMNETTANIVGKEIGAALIARYYPERVPPEQVASSPSTAAETLAAPVFDFQREMHSTRVRVDELLAQGKVDEAEQYMEERRLMFWDHGYVIRKLNQAYFAFYGSYADVPVGPAGEDPVGAAVRELRTQSETLVEFLNRMAGLTSFDGLKQLLNQIAR
jgi:hypothetical protein